MSSPLDVIEGRARWCVVEGDALAMLAALPDASVHAIITDEPYSSGGTFRADRARSTDVKYTDSRSRGARPDFAGDVRDQRSWSYWCALWLSECLRAATADARLVTFADWRQLPTMTDAVQAGGWIWRGIAPWDKTEAARPVPGGFRAQCEYLVWATNGPLPPPAVGTIFLPGILRHPVVRDDKHHQTGKPTALMRDVVRIVPRDAAVVDPFAGSGTTGVAGLVEGRRVILCERVPEIAEKARQRCAAAAGEGPSAVSGQQGVLDLHLDAGAP